MKLTVVGCSGSVSGPESPASSYLVQAPYEGRVFSLVLDLGPGALGALYRYLDPRDIDAFALSHLHPDHCLDLCAAYVAGRYSPSAPWPRRPVHGPTGTAQRMGRAYDVARFDGGTSEAGPSIAEHFDYRDWQPVQQIGPFTVQTARVDHPVEAYAIRVEEQVPHGGTLVFSGDTGPCPALVELAAGVDLLLVEAAFLDRPGNPTGVHLNGREAAQAGAAAGVGSIVLTHIPPWHDPDQVLAQAMPHFDGPVALAVSGASWTIGAPGGFGK
ncbi:MAG TPA: MBL fold metallo-hydrolase [Propionibacteriaceae bacterium]